jgi:DNA-binding transcriptional regulator YiaG
MNTAEKPEGTLRRLRRQLAMTQEEFSGGIGVTVSTVNRWENGHAQPSRLAWRAIEGIARRHGLACETPESAGTERPSLRIAG